MHAFKRVPDTTSRHVDATTMGSIKDAIAFLRSSDGRNVAAVAKRFNVNRSTLSKRFRGKTGSVARRICCDLASHVLEDSMDPDDYVICAETRMF